MTTPEQRIQHLERELEQAKRVIQLLTWGDKPGWDIGPNGEHRMRPPLHTAKTYDR